MATFLEDPGTFEEFIDKFLSGKGEGCKYTVCQKCQQNIHSKV